MSEKVYFWDYEDVNKLASGFSILPNRGTDFQHTLATFLDFIGPLCLRQGRRVVCGPAGGHIDTVVGFLPAGKYSTVAEALKAFQWKSNV